MRPRLAVLGQAWVEAGIACTCWYWTQASRQEPAIDLKYRVCWRILKIGRVLPLKFENRVATLNTNLLHFPVTVLLSQKATHVWTGSRRLRVGRLSLGRNLMVEEFRMNLYEA